MTDKTALLDAAERVIAVLKQIGLIMLLAYLAWYLVPFIPKWAAKLEGSEIAEVILPGFSLKLAPVERQLEQALNLTTPSNSSADQVVSPEKKLVAEALGSVRALRAESVKAQAAETVPNIGAKKAPNEAGVAQPFWVYLGPATAGTLQAKNFKTSRVPAPGETLEAGTDIYRRTTAPIYNDAQGWQLGDILGVLHSGQRVTVKRLEKIESTQPGSEIIWAEVTAAQ